MRLFSILSDFSDIGRKLLGITLLLAIPFWIGTTTNAQPSQPSGLPSQSPVASGWADDGAVVRLTNNADNVGVGTNSPAAKLDIIGNIKITDGTEGAGKVLTSDVTGLSSWQTLSTGGVSGSGTAGFITQWVTNSSLGDATAKVKENGDIILKPGISLFLLSDDGLRCIKITSDGFTLLHRLGLPCPSF